MYAPGVVADAILYAAEKAPRDIVAGGAGKGMILGQRLSPRLMDPIMLRGGFESQMTDEPRAEADFGNQTLSRSLATWLDIHPVAKRVLLAGAALGIAATLRARS